MSSQNGLVAGNKRRCYNSLMIPFFRSALPITLYNTLSGKKEEFRPKSGRTVKLYTCGPTVYNFAHIGNLRTYIFEDVLRRIMELSGYRVFQVMNITDIDDKIIKSSIESGKLPEEITLPFEKHFFEDIAKLNIETPEKTPRATGHIKAMISLIEKLMEKGYAYKGEDGSIYFSVSKFKDYGRLTHPDLEGQKAASLDRRRTRLAKASPRRTRLAEASPGRTSADEYEKDEAEDFALWKAKKSGELSWNSPWGEGRPGWHIECSAMAMEYLGETLDIHTGGVDNAFPHHENEIAQSEAATGKPFSRFFMHGEHLLVNGVKMAKSAGNFYTLREIEEKGYDPLAFRYLCLQTHYRSKMNFTWEALEAANSALQNLRQAYSSHKNAHGPNGPVKPSRNKKTEKEILDALSDDLNTPRALAALWNAIKDRNISAEEKLYLADYADRVLGLRISSGPDVSDHTVPDEIRNLAEKREELRRQKDYAAADDARKSIEEKGYEISDGPEGYIIRKKI